MTASKLAVGMLTATLLLAQAGAAQQRPQDRRYRPNPQEVEALVKRIEKGSNKFKKSVDKGLDNSRLNQTRTETEINTYVREFENSADRLKKNTRRGDLSEQDAREVLRRADRIDRFMDRYNLGHNAETDWDALRRDLDNLARISRVSWQWGGRGRPGWTRDGNRDRDGRDRDDRWRDDRGRNDNRYNYEEVRGIIAQIETGANRFRRSLDEALDRSRLNQTPAEREINQYVRDFENATDQLKQRSQQREPISQLARDVLQRGDYIDRFMTRNRLGDRAERDWSALRNDLDRLAGATRVAWRWGNR
jgi:hypothetical protein